MGKKKAARGPGEGTKVRARDGVAIPEFPDVLCGGWTGVVLEVSGKENPQYVIQWDPSALEKMPASYIEACEKNNFLHSMACLPADSLEFLADAS